MDLIKKLNELANNGFCPALLFDDDGRWALVFDGTSTVNISSTPQEMQFGFYVPAEYWKNTIEEAIEYTVKKYE